MARGSGVDLYGAMTLGAGVGLLAARVMHFDIGLALVVGALIGLARALLDARSRTGGHSASRD